MVEARLLATVRGAEAMLEGSRNVQTERFVELASFQVTTESGSQYSFGMEDMLSDSNS